ncbi:ABC-type Fe3+-hydroxamate transport system, substrate-binding protein [Cyclonatronum proteinivorum]|uniref:ABC-type Fe3+-hydroxamate transport system, substrate-binding protein n=1 Tax=Cyclonatronum proteinivorum TaxID=1457365 RepID=A0A345UPB3_9BACT|nr:helical backbone metal receptor [Cyclonatronum proteinivorum]AXJ02315.1 ABC-type Fe3+-hydroxamate transport system, substrate-binding protein [Cyclonatronum proteinivorum]
MRVVSLVPSLTELLFDLGGEIEVVGRTRFCIHPAEKISEATIVGGTKNPRIDRIRALKPDLVVLNREENRREDADAIRDFAPLLVTEISTVEQALGAIQEIGAATGTAEAATRLCTSIRAEMPSTETYTPLRTAYLIWKKPLMSVGGDTYIHDVMRLFGFENVFGNVTRYPETSYDELAARGTELVLLSSEPYPFKTSDADEVREALPGSLALTADGEAFSWYGSRMRPAFKALRAFRARIDTLSNA